MKRILAVIALSCAAALVAACDPKAENSAAAEVPEPVASAEAAPPTVPASTPTAAPPAPAGGSPAAPDAPSFTVLYPGGVPDAPAVTASGPAGPGGVVTYTTDADPDAVIAFHRARAEAAGLTTAMAMNQGEARAYGAASTDTGASFQVVASATEDGPTSVQLTWSAGH
ncbi:hypothetical protein [Brevundimonas sp.]|uniref:hypothetical protein n=1 Tax=Brevundimonas sp. TaxID=1871086 RepID=UPI00262B968D|nr:hypothetical protein [Brevundimonas sp.]